MTEPLSRPPLPRPIPPAIVEFPRVSWQSYALAGALRTAVRPVANRWPHTPRALSTVDRIVACSGRIAERAHIGRRRAHARLLDIDGVPALLVRAPSVITPERTVVHFHGGGFVFGNPDMYREFALRLSAATNAEVVVFDYRHPPHASAEQMIADCMAVYRWAVESTAADRLVTSGDSAGGNLMFGTLVAARDAGLPLPQAVLAQSAWLDLALPHARRAPVDAFFSLRFAGRAERILRGDGELPSAFRPLEMDLSGLPPVLLQVGAQEPLRPANERFAHLLGTGGVPAELQLWHRQVHVFQAFGGFLPEGRAAFERAADFLNTAAGASATPRRRSQS